jgi:hypothetical protein
MGVNRRGLMREERAKYVAGSMFMFFYDPKHRATLPYYDSFPLIIAVGPAPGGFYGLNLHYLPIPLRAKFLDELVGITSNNRYDESTKFDLSYQYLKTTSSMKYFKPCYKHYLTKQVEGKLAYIPPPEWEIATFLPAAQWQKGGRSQAYSDARKMI